MAHIDTTFPDDIGYGSRSGPGWNTSIVRLAGGGEERSARWETPIHRFDVSYGLRSWADLYTVKVFAYARRGALISFNFKDWSDYASTTTGTVTLPGDVAVTRNDVSIGIGDASETQFQLIKEYTNGGVTRTRNITKPVGSTVLIAFDGVDQASGWTVSEATGVVTFTSAPGSSVDITAGFEFEVPVRFGSSTEKWLAADQASFNNGTVAGIELEEVRDGIFVPEEVPTFGFKRHDSLAATTTIDLTAGRFHVLDVAAGSLEAILQRADDLPTGHFVFTLSNTGSFSIDVVAEAGGSVVVALTAGSTVSAHLHETGGSKVWIAG